MATPMTVLKMVFKDTSEKNKTINLNYADNEADSDDVNTLMGVIISNGSIWADTPVSKVSAQLVTTSIRDIIIS